MPSKTKTKIKELYAKIKNFVKITGIKTKNKIDNFKKKLQIIYKERILYRLLLEWNRLLSFKKHLVQIPSLIAVILLISVILLSIFDFLKVANLKPTILSDFAFTIAAILGTAISIVFSLSVFALQGAAKLYSSRYFSLFKIDWISISTYSTLIIFSIYFLSLGLLLDSETAYFQLETIKAVTYSSLFLVLLSFLLVARHYINVTKKTDPNNALIYASRHVDSLFKEIDNYTARTHKVTKLRRPEVNENTIKIRIFHEYSNYIKKIIDDVFALTLRLADNKDTEATQNAITTIQFIVIKFFDLRKNTTPLTDNEGHFLALILEKLESLGEKFIQEREISNARYVADVFKNLAIQSINVTPNQFTREHPTLNLIIIYIKKYLDFAIREDEDETILSIVRNFKDIVLAAEDSNLELSIKGIQEKLLEIVVPNIQAKRAFIIDEIIKCYLINLTYAFRTERMYINFGTPLDYLGQIAITLDVAIHKGHMAKLTDEETLSEIFYQLSNIAANAYNLIRKANTQKERKQNAKLFLEYTQEIYLLIKELSKSTNICNSLLSASIGSLIEELLVILKDLLHNIHLECLEIEILTQIHGLLHSTYYIVSNSRVTKTSRNFYKLIDPIHEFIICNFQTRNFVKIAESGAKSLNSIANAMVEKNFEKGFYESLEIMLKICQIGMLAKKSGHTELLIQIISIIRAFEVKFEKQYFDGTQESIKSQFSLETKLLQWQHHFIETGVNEVGFTKSSTAMMKEKINREDITEFIQSMWGYESYINRLIEVLKIITKSSNHQD